MDKDRSKDLTIRDIARMAGVSVATVSNVINGTGRVSKETTNRVVVVIEQAEFNVNVSARSLRIKSSQIIGVLVPGDGDELIEFNPYYWQFVDGVMQVANRQGYDVILRSVPSDFQLKLIQERRVDGIIAIGAYDGETFTERVLSSGIPSIFVDSYINGHVDTVHLDDQFGCYLATRHLLSIGHRKILFLSPSLRRGGVDYERFLGYQRALTEYEIQSDAEIFETDVSLESGKLVAHRLAYMKGNITAIVTTADLLAIGLIRGFGECGISVPNNISITGFDDIRESAYTIPALTTVRQDVLEKGRHAAQRLLELINSTKTLESKAVILTPKLVIRESTAPCL